MTLCTRTVSPLWLTHTDLRSVITVAWADNRLSQLLVKLLVKGTISFFFLNNSDQMHDLNWTLLQSRLFFNDLVGNSEPWRFGSVVSSVTHSIRDSFELHCTYTETMVPSKFWVTCKRVKVESSHHRVLDLSPSHFWMFSSPLEPNHFSECCREFIWEWTSSWLDLGLVQKCLGRPSTLDCPALETAVTPCADTCPTVEGDRWVLSNYSSSNPFNWSWLHLHLVNNPVLLTSPISRWSVNNMWQ